MRIVICHGCGKQAECAKLKNGPYFCLECVEVAIDLLDDMLTDLTPVLKVSNGSAN